MQLPEMEAQATEAMVIGLVARIERFGHCLTPRQVEAIHRIITDAQPDTRSEGTQKQLSEMINERIERDGREGQ